MEGADLEPLRRMTPPAALTKQENTAILTTHHTSLSFPVGKMGMRNPVFRLVGMGTSWLSPQWSTWSQHWSLPFAALLRAFLKYRIIRRMSTSTSRTPNVELGTMSCQLP